MEDIKETKHSNPIRTDTSELMETGSRNWAFTGQRQLADQYRGRSKHKPQSLTQKLSSTHKWKFSYLQWSLNGDVNHS